MTEQERVYLRKCASVGCLHLISNYNWRVMELLDEVERIQDIAINNTKQYLELKQETDRLREEIEYLKKMKDRYRKRLNDYGEKDFEPDFLDTEEIHNHKCGYFPDDCEVCKKNG